MPQVQMTSSNPENLEALILSEAEAIAAQMGAIAPAAQSEVLGGD